MVINGLMLKHVNYVQIVHVKITNIMIGIKKFVKNVMIIVFNVIYNLLNVQFAKVINI